MWDISERKEFEEKLKKSYEEITRLSQHVVSIRETEQKKISALLHDDLGQLLTAIKMDVSWIKSNSFVDDSKIKQRAGSALEVVDKALKSIKYLTSELRPPVLENLGLFDAIEHLLIQFKERSNIQIQFIIPGNKIEINSEI